MEYAIEVNSTKVRRVAQCAVSEGYRCFMSTPHSSAQVLNQLSRADLSFGDMRSTKTNLLAYDEALEVKAFVTKSNSVKSEHLLPNPFKRKGRPKKKRIELQHAT